MLKFRLIICILFIYNLNAVSQNCPTGACANYTEFIDMDAQPNCSSGMSVDFIGDIDNNSDCEDINGGNCYRWIISRSPTSSVQGITAEIGQGNGCNGEADNFYTLIGGMCIDHGSSGSQNSFTFSFGTSDTITIWICDGSSGVVGICAICAEYSLLPVEFESFEAENQENNIVLSWSTRTEINNEGFVIQKKYSNSDWVDVDFVHGNGNSNRRNTYRYEDNTFHPAGLISYRLKQIDYDGVTSYSEIKELEIKPESNLLREAMAYGTYYNILGQPISEKTGLVIISYKGRSYKLYITE